MRIPQITAFLGRPEQQREIHPRVDNRPAVLISIPGTDEMARQVIAASQKIGSKERTPFRFVVASQLVLDYRRWQKLKADVMVKMISLHHQPLQPFIPVPGCRLVLLFACHSVGDPQHARPKTGRPPIEPHIIILAGGPGCMRRLPANRFQHPVQLQQRLLPSRLHAERVPLTHIPTSSFMLHPVFNPNPSKNRS
ncbi:hypothetical protein D3C77_449610 [compost metagenome]